MPKFYKILLLLITVILLELIIFGNKPIIKKSAGLHQVYSYSSKRITIFIDLTTNCMKVFQDGNVIRDYTISGGKDSTPSPIGTFTIISKDTWGEGFGGHWMGLSVPWGKYGIHGTIFPNLIGSNISKGCIRMKSSDIKELYIITPHGTKVIIYGGVYGMFGEYFRVLKPGSRGSDVYETERLLKEKGYFNGYTDGIYGESLKSAVHKFQKENRLPITDYINYSFYKKLGVKTAE